MATAKAVTCNGGKYFGIIEVGALLCITYRERMAAVL
jgi:hypothetical protein